MRARGGGLRADPRPTAVAPPRTQPPPLQLREYLSVLWVRKAWILLVALIAAAAAFAYTVQQTPIYKSTATVEVRSIVVSSSDAPNIGTVAQMETERQIALSAATLNRALATLHLAPTQRLGAVSIDAVKDSAVLEFTASSSSPDLAQRTAQAFADSYLEVRRQQVIDDSSAAAAPISQRIKDLDQQISALSSRLPTAPDEPTRAALQVQYNTLVSERATVQQRLDNVLIPEKLQVGQVLQPANFPDGPASPNLSKNEAFAIFVGLSLGVGLAFLRDRLDDRVRGPADLEARVGTPVLAAVPRHGYRARRAPVTLIEPHSRAAEAYRALRTNVLYACTDRGLRTIMVTSPERGDGKTTTVVNLGVALAQAGRQVVLVDGDLRNGRLKAQFGINRTAERPPPGPPRPTYITKSGHSVGALGSADVGMSLTPVPVAKGLRLMEMGPLVANDEGFLGSDAMRDLLASLAPVADVVLIDSPAVLPVADAAALAPLTDGVILVVNGQRTTVASVETAARRLAQVNSPVIGTVLQSHGRGSANLEQ